MILTPLKDHSVRDNLHFDVIREWNKESWADTEQMLKDTLSEVLLI